MPKYSPILPKQPIDTKENRKGINTKIFSGDIDNSSHSIYLFIIISTSFDGFQERDNESIEDISQDNLDYTFTIDINKIPINTMKYFKKLKSTSITRIKDFRPLLDEEFYFFMTKFGRFKVQLEENFIDVEEVELLDSMFAPYDEGKFNDLEKLAISVLKPKHSITRADRLAFK